MFERFTEGARAIVVEAQALALELGSGQITPMHVLYGCAQGREETAGQPLHDAGITGESIRQLLPRTGDQDAADVDPEALRALGIDYEAVCAAVDDTFGADALRAAPDRRIPTRRRKPRFTTSTKHALEQALRVARELRSDRLHPGHLLLGLLRLEDDLILSAIENSDTTVGALSAAVHTQLSAAA